MATARIALISRRMQTGRIWQAEEVREGDRWRRFYGFVGRHALTRVPAEEVEFPPEKDGIPAARAGQPGLGVGVGPSSHP